MMKSNLVEGTSYQQAVVSQRVVFYKRYFKEFARCKFGFGWQYDLSKKLNHFYKRIGWMT